MRILFTLLILITTTAGIGQTMNDYKIILTDVQGIPLDVKTETNVEGSVFFNDNYLPGRITVKGKTYADIDIKLNLQKNIVSFIKDGIEMVPAGIVSSVEFFEPYSNTYSKVFKNGFPNIDKNSTQTFYQVIDSGKALLLKHIGIASRESQAYGESVIMKKYEQVKSYYIFANGIIVPAKKSDAVLEAFKDKQEKVQAFMSSNKIKPNKEDDLKALVSFYNKL